MNRIQLKIVMATVGAIVASTLPLAAVDAAPARAPASGVVRVQATAAFVGTCGDRQGAPYYFHLTGDLRGCWAQYPETVKRTPSGMWIERGTEIFDGCITTPAGEVCGAFFTHYQFQGKYTPGDTAEIFGGCQHWVDYGEGGFAGIKGFLKMKDDVTTFTAAVAGNLFLPNLAESSSLSTATASTNGASEGC
jgi:hypothetical protein